MSGKLFNQIQIGSLAILTLFTFCTRAGNNQKNHIPAPPPQAQSADMGGKSINELGKDIRHVLQDKNGHYWFATYGEGLYRYDGEALRQITDKDGLCSNFVSDIQEDIAGNLWFNTSEGLCKFDGKNFINFTDTLTHVSIERLDFKSDDLFFCYNGIVYRYDGSSFTKFIIHPATYKPSPADLDRPYGVYCVLKDKSGNLWFGTDQKGVCRYDGKTFTYFTAHGLSGGAVRALFQDKNGHIWFGNNGYGLFRYDGRTLANFTEENELGNSDFVNKRATSTGKPNLARVWTINEDKAGNLWIGTIDHGAWRYDGKRLKNFTVKDGLANNKVSTIYKDKQNDLWYITEGGGICKFNGQTFDAFTNFK